MQRKDQMHIKVYADHDLIQVSHVTASLLELEAQGLVSLDWHLPFKIPPKPAMPVAVRVEATTPGQEPVRHVFDLHDDNECFDPYALDWCDYYWKSTYHADAISRLEEPLRGKVRHYGFHFGVRSRNDREVPLRYLGSSLADRAYRRHKNGVSQSWRGNIRWIILRNRRYRSLLFRDQYESQSMERPAGVYFHPGCYQMGRSETLDGINLLRRDLIRSLRASVGDRFVGGFTDNTHARKQFPEEIFKQTLTHREYVAQLQSTHIVISTNGLSGCHSWRTAEALAAGAILVTERPICEVDDKLKPGENAFFYDTAEECAEICRDLLSRGESALQDLHRQSQAYYSECVAPGGRMLERLKSAKQVTSTLTDPVKQTTLVSEQ